MKKILCIMAVLLFLSGCQSETAKDDEIIPEEIQPCTLKWCLEACGLDENIIGNLNDALREDGCEYSVELIQIPLDPARLYSEQVLEYEENYGNLDVVSTGYVFANNIGETNEFVKSGYFTELDDLSVYTSVPEKLWETVKVDGKIYTVPGLNVNDSGTTFYFNKAYISQEQIDVFNGDIAKIKDMTSGLSATEDFLPIYYGIDYTDWSYSSPYTQKGGIILDNASHKALNPYEFDPFVEYAKKMNELYKKGMCGDKVNFSVNDNPSEDPPKDFAVMVLPVMLSENYISDMTQGDKDLFCYTLPRYLENRVPYSMGISENSRQKEQALDFLKRLYSDNKYAKILLEGTGAEAMQIGAAVADIKENYTNATVSDFAGFELSHKDINNTLRDMLVGSFDRLCKAEDFYAVLDEINAELKTAGIDNYVDKVNKLLEESVY